MVSVRLAKKIGFHVSCYCLDYKEPCDFNLRAGRMFFCHISGRQTELHICAHNPTEWTQEPQAATYYPAFLMPT